MYSAKENKLLLKDGLRSVDDVKYTFGSDGCRVIRYKQWVLVSGGRSFSNTLAIFQVERPRDQDPKSKESEYEYEYKLKLVKQCELPIHYCYHGFMILNEINDHKIDGILFGGKGINFRESFCTFVIDFAFDGTIVIASMQNNEEEEKANVSVDAAETNERTTDVDNYNVTSSNYKNGDDCNENDDGRIMIEIEEGPYYDKHTAPELPNYDVYGFTCHLLDSRYLMIIGGANTHVDCYTTIKYFDFKRKEWCTNKRSLPRGIALIIINNGWSFHI